MMARVIELIADIILLQIFSLLELLSKCKKFVVRTLALADELAKKGRKSLLPTGRSTLVLTTRTQSIQTSSRIGKHRVHDSRKRKAKYCKKLAKPPLYLRRIYRLFPGVFLANSAALRDRLIHLKRCILLLAILGCAGRSPPTPSAPQYLLDGITAPQSYSANARFVARNSFPPASFPIKLYGYLSDCAALICPQ